MKQRMKENLQVTVTMIAVLVIAVLCFIFRYDGEYQGNYTIMEKEELTGAPRIHIMEGDTEVMLKCDQETYDQIAVNSDQKYYISYQSLRFGNGAGKLTEIREAD